VISAGFGATFMVAMLTGGRALYAALGGEGATLDAALTYSNIVFAGIVLLWVFNALANIIRGSGNMMTPSLVISIGALIVIPVSPLLIFGWGPFPALGVAGGGVAVVAYYFFGSLVLVAYLRRTGGAIRLPFSAALRWPLFRDILRVGAVAAIITLSTNLTVAITTGLIGSFGAGAIAGYGTGSRLEYLLIPLVFGFGAPLVAMVGTNIGAGRLDRALRAAWIGAAISGGLTEAIGLAAAAFPLAWLTLFGSDPGMLDAGARYLRIVGPVYGLFGFGMALYFASQGAGRLIWPLAAGFVRFVIAAGGGYLALRATGDMNTVFAALAVALVSFGAINTAAVAGGAWKQRTSP
jgi:Na+-driven multidrug efflux pump